MRLRYPLALAVAFAGLSDAQAAFLVSVGSTTLTAGGSGVLNVTISGGPERLDIFSLDLRITGGPAGGLRFTSPQSNAQLAAPNYVFAGDSAGGPGAVGTVANPNDRYVGGDGTLSGNGVALTPTRNLLVRVNLSAVAAGTYTVGLVPTGSTTFLDPNGSPSSYAATAGTVTVNPAPATVATPAPAGVLVLAAAAGLLGLARRLRPAAV